MHDNKYSNSNPYQNLKYDFTVWNFTQTHYTNLIIQKIQAAANIAT
jgi:hypothetical protein